MARRKLRVPPEKMMINIDRYGNTSAASIPLALVDAVEEGRIKPGDNLVFVGFGAGLTWAAAAFHFEPQEPAGILIRDWPMRERLSVPVTRARSALWSARVGLATKAEALRFLTARYGVPPEKTLAIGDNWNDLEMLETAGMAVLMSNAPSELLSRGFATTATNDEAGVAKAIYKYVIS